MADLALAQESSVSAPAASRRDSWGLRAWRLLLVCVVMVHLFPIRFGLLRLAMVVASACVWLGVLPLFGSRKWVRVAWLACTMLLGALFFGPGRADDPRLLRQEYVRSLQRYDGVRYVWGGENARGIDCSGLVRVGLIDADFRRGITTLNPALLREGASLWWHDCSANALKNEYRHDSIGLFTASNLNTLDYSKIRPGDFCVTENGNHTLAYTGDDTWIEADPYPARVISITCPSKSVWFDQPMRILRWRQLR